MDCERCGKDVDTHPTVDVSNTDRLALCQDRAIKWVKVEAGFAFPKGSPYRIEHPDGTAYEGIAGEGLIVAKVSEHPMFRDSSWKPPLVLPDVPTWGIAVHRQFDKGWGFGLWHLDGDEFWQDHAHARFSWRPHNVLDFIPLTDEQVARIEQAP